jgi:hypothetical protein
MLRDPVWRLTNLYWIKTDKGKPVRFVPNEAQQAIINAVYVLGLRKILIPRRASSG